MIFLLRAYAPRARQIKQLDIIHTELAAELKKMEKKIPVTWGGIKGLDKDSKDHYCKAMEDGGECEACVTRSFFPLCLGRSLYNPPCLV